MPGPPELAEIEVAQLVRGAQRGDPAAFAELYRRFARMVHGVVLARTSRTDVDDVVQAVFVTALGRLKDLREPAAFGGWVGAIARHRATDYTRRQPLTEELVNDVPS